MNADDLYTILHAKEVENGIEPTAIIREWYIDSTNVSTTKLGKVKLRGLDATAQKRRAIVTGRLAKRCTRRILQTDSGSFYKLHGPCSEQRMAEQGWSSGFIKVFTTGFPTNWKSFIEDELVRMKVRRELDGINENGAEATVVASRSRTPVREEGKTRNNNANSPAVPTAVEHLIEARVEPIALRSRKKRTRSPVEKDASPVRLPKRRAAAEKEVELVEERNPAKNAAIRSSLRKAGPSQSETVKKKSSVISTRPSRPTRGSKEDEALPTVKPTRQTRNAEEDAAIPAVKPSKQPRGAKKGSAAVKPSRHTTGSEKLVAASAVNPSLPTRSSTKVAVAPAAKPSRQTRRSTKHAAAPVVKPSSRTIDAEQDAAAPAAKSSKQTRRSTKDDPVPVVKRSNQTMNGKQVAAAPAVKFSRQTRNSTKDGAGPAEKPPGRTVDAKQGATASAVKPVRQTRRSAKDAAVPVVKPSSQTIGAEKDAAAPAAKPFRHSRGAKKGAAIPTVKPSRQTRSAKKAAAAPDAKPSRQTRSAIKDTAKPADPLKSPPKKRTVKWYKNAVDNISHIPSARKRAAAVLFSPVPPETGDALPEADWSSAELEDDFTPVTFSDTTRTFRMSAGQKSGRKSVKHVPSNAATAADRQHFRGFLEQEKEQRKKRPRKSPERSQQSSIWSRQGSGQKKVGKNLQIPALPDEGKI